MLSDEHTYEQLKSDPTGKYKRRLISTLARLKKEEKISKVQYDHLYPTSESVPRIYCTPKIHKTDVPLRPIVDYTGSIGYNTSRALADLLDPLVGLTKHHAKNSKELAKELSQVKISNKEMFNSHDVVALSTNTPIQKTLQIVRDRLNADKKLGERTKLNVNDIMELTEFIATMTYFSFRGIIYIQKFRTAMGSPVSPILANLYMEWLEKTAIETAPTAMKPKIWKCYVDDILEIINKGEVENLTQHLNQVDHTGSIKFTDEPEKKRGKIPFLDTLIIRKPDQSVKLKIYRKSTHTDQYLAFDSHHSLPHKLGVVRTLLDRCFNIITEKEDQEEEIRHIKSALKTCGYPAWSFKKVKEKIKEKKEQKQKPANQKEDKEKSKGMVVVPYLKGTTEQLQRVFRKYRIATSIKPHQTICNILVHPKDKINKETRKLDAKHQSDGLDDIRGLRSIMADFEEIPAPVPNTSDGDAETVNLLGGYEDHTEIPSFQYGAIAAHGTARGYEQRRRLATDDTFIHPDHGTYLALKVDTENPNLDDIPSDNPTTVALRICQKQVLAPYVRFLFIVGWEPVFDSATSCIQKTINVVHPLLVVILIVLGYVIQYAGCFRRDQADYIILPPGENKTNSSEWVCEQFIISQYIIPDILHSVAYVYSFYTLRIAETEQLPVLMERVFVQTAHTEMGLRKQGKLIIKLRALLYGCVVWVCLSQIAQIEHIIAQYEHIDFTWLEPASVFGRIVLVILMMISFVFLDVVYMAVVIHYCVQCFLLIQFIGAIIEKVTERSSTLDRAMKDIAQLQLDIRILNERPGIALSLILINFGTMSVLGTLALLNPAENNYSALMYAGTTMAVLLWWIAMIFPVMIAAYLTSRCKRLRTLGHTIRVRPFGFQDVLLEELDSFMLYISTLKLTSKIFLIPVKAENIFLIAIVISMTLLLLFQTGVFHVWL